MKRRACGSLAIKVMAEEREVTVEMNGHAKTVKASEHLWELQELLASCEPELILLDLHLPITFGVKLLDVIRQTHPHVPIATEVESKASGQHFFYIEAAERGIVLKPFQSGTFDSSPRVGKEYLGTGSLS